MRNDVQTAHLDAYERMLDGMREVVARMQEGEEASARELYARLIQDYAQTVFQAGMNAYQSRQADDDPAMEGCGEKGRLGHLWDVVLATVGGPLWRCPRPSTK